VLFKVEEDGCVGAALEVFVRLEGVDYKVDVGGERGEEDGLVEGVLGDATDWAFGRDEVGRGDGLEGDLGLGERELVVGVGKGKFVETHGLAP
jgi:hypothetical protein